MDFISNLSNSDILHLTILSFQISILYRFYNKRTRITLNPIFVDGILCNYEKLNNSISDLQKRLETIESDIRHLRKTILISFSSSDDESLEF